MRKEIALPLLVVATAWGASAGTTGVQPVARIDNGIFAVQRYHVEGGPQNVLDLQGDGPSVGLPGPSGFTDGALHTRQGLNAIDNECGVTNVSTLDNGHARVTTVKDNCEPDPHNLGQAPAILRDTNAYRIWREGPHVF